MLPPRRPLMTQHHSLIWHPFSEVFICIFLLVSFFFFSFLFKYDLFYFKFYSLFFCRTEWCCPHSDPVCGRLGSGRPTRLSFIFIFFYLSSLYPVPSTPSIHFVEFIIGYVQQLLGTAHQLWLRWVITFVLFLFLLFLFFLFTDKIKLELTLIWRMHGVQRATRSCAVFVRSSN